MIDKTRTEFEKGLEEGTAFGLSLARAVQDAGGNALTSSAIASMSLGEFLRIMAANRIRFVHIPEGLSMDKEKTHEGEMATTGPTQLEIASGELDKFVAYYLNRFREMIDLSSKAREFFSPDFLALSSVMKAAVWRLHLGCVIHKVDVVVRQPGASRVYLALLPDSGSTEAHVFTSDRAEDARILRLLKLG